MKINLEELYKDTPNYKKLHGNKDIDYIFENIICNYSNIIKMYDASLANVPALSAIVNEIEFYYDSLVSPSFDLSDDFTKTYIGRCIGLIMGYLGFEKSDSTRISKGLKSKYFSTGSRFKQSDSKVAKIIVKKELIFVD